MSSNNRQELRPVKIFSLDKNFVAEVEKTINKWCLTVLELPERKMITQDFFDDHWKAVARAQDFIQIINNRNKISEKYNEEAR
jgi:1,2-phenylacetyl-CoA epoxidase catalytic subunit